ncbi:ATP-dependent RNA helicase RhlE [Tamilnaduibacter salinus]|uniref:ATP-dependent RNA helicase RhlE n=1 Tax=Tamilnaduibacter salinus TaxID=1484056 RepID=A0A2A2I0G0_9GAMM|nr:DEAD/DEAH box helicase [Tamilnaduibacter salinus]PAV24774.1 ATP-dependent RNA helicase RhlE [Tamilnaduibacter salinus]
MRFSDLGLSEQLVRATSEQKYDTPTKIQSEAIPAVLSGRDVMAAAQTGTGKTAGFTLPLLQRLGARPRNGRGVRALVLTPTRELAAQVHDSVHLYGRYAKIRSTVVFGGVKINPQINKLRRGVDVLVATPGRLLDLYQQGAVEFDALETLIMDEADRMLDMGFIRDIRRILSLLPKERQNLMFSATFSGEIRKLASSMLNNPVEIDVAPRNTAAETVQQSVHPVDQGRKADLLTQLVADKRWEQVLVFTRTKHGANKLTTRLEKDGISAAAIHGNKSQGARTKALKGFKDGRVRVLVATDIAARGLDIKQLPQVVNFELPQVPEDYVHRIGRTGRAGETGHAVSLVSPDEAPMLGGIEKLISREIPRETIDGFEPSRALNVRAKGGKPGGRSGGPKGGNRNARPGRGGGGGSRGRGQPGRGRSSGPARRSA